MRVIHSWFRSVAFFLILDTVWFSLANLFSSIPSHLGIYNVLAVSGGKRGLTKTFWWVAKDFGFKGMILQPWLCCNFNCTKTTFPSPPPWISNFEWSWWRLWILSCRCRWQVAGEVSPQKTSSKDPFKRLLQIRSPQLQSSYSSCPVARKDQAQPIVLSGTNHQGDLLQVQVTSNYPSSHQLILPNLPQKDTSQAACWVVFLVLLLFGLFFFSPQKPPKKNTSPLLPSTLPFPPRHGRRRIWTAGASSPSSPSSSCASATSPSAATTTLWRSSRWARNISKGSGSQRNGLEEAETYWGKLGVKIFSPPVRWGLLDFMSALPPPPPASSRRQCSPPDLNCQKLCQI